MNWATALPATGGIEGLLQVVDVHPQLVVGAGGGLEADDLRHLLALLFGLGGLGGDLLDLELQVRDLLGQLVRIAHLAVPEEHGDEEQDEGDDERPDRGAAFLIAHLAVSAGAVGPHSVWNCREERPESVTLP